MKTRVLVLDQGNGIWGAQRCLLRLAPMLEELGLNLILGGPPDLELADAWRSAGLTHVVVNSPTDRSIRRHGDVGPVSPTRLAREAMQARRHIAEIADTAAVVGADVIWANSHWVHLDAALAGRKSRIPVVLYLHEEAIAGLGVMLRSMAVNRASRAIAVSTAVSSGVVRATDGKVIVVPNGVDADTLNPGFADPEVRASLGAAPGDVLAVALTRLDPVKRIEDVVRAAVCALDAGGGLLPLKLAIVGTTSTYPAYAREATANAERMLGHRVLFAGMRDDVADILRASDILVHAGVIEGMPLGMLEAQACGTPVAAYSAAGVDEAVIDGVSGLLVSPGDVVGLGNALLTLAEAPELRAKMGAAGRLHVLEHHTIKGQAAEVARHLHELGKAKSRNNGPGFRRSDLGRSRNRPMQTGLSLPARPTQIDDRVLSDRAVQ